MTDPEITTKYTKLESILKEVITHLSTNTTIDRIDNNIVKYLLLLTSQGSVIPLKFFTLFELCRLETKEGEFVSLNENQQKMIIGFFLFIKILLNLIFLPKLGELAGKKKNENTYK